MELYPFGCTHSAVRIHLSAFICPHSSVCIILSVFAVCIHEFDADARVFCFRSKNIASFAGRRLQGKHLADWAKVTATPPPKEVPVVPPGCARTPSRSRDTVTELLFDHHRRPLVGAELPSDSISIRVECRCLLRQILLFRSMTSVIVNINVNVIIMIKSLPMSHFLGT